MSKPFRQPPARQRIRKALVLASFLLFPITLNFLSPYLIVAGAMEGVVNGSLILFALLFVGSLFFRSRRLDQVVHLGAVDHPDRHSCPPGRRLSRRQPALLHRERSLGR